MSVEGWFEIRYPLNLATAKSFLESLRSQDWQLGYENVCEPRIELQSLVVEALLEKNRKVAEEVHG
ncbi:hypothetical protein MPTK1_7g08590 [Marchantia polymorpha subsp. ruderalis]|uniref:Uncharacterized protein n=2 Tax=Marchantia polymorpha TaxID=3197 RepID=A0AAF6BXG8_MARPO|nr:hypothetical protein MARPO_0068s0013 [Marchantia polymorpha]BBN16702.1 hypothetical protein Mp_7g08590 [Marchantia polymorpha subsp. ruderalis]|eukprot:PTQ35785.1 hypothetical protein MARPO_0068s0013 [Marchantia polymorpha]